MSIRINSNFEMGAPLPIDTRFNLTYTQMANINDNIMPPIYISMCLDDGYIYIYNKNNAIQEKTGKFIKFGAGSDYSTQLIFSTRSEFPSEGTDQTLYIAEDENTIYRYDITTHKYEGLSALDIYTEIYDVGSFKVLTDKPDDWEINWMNYFTLSYDELVTEPFNFNPTRHYYFNGSYHVAGEPTDTWTDHTWYDKHFIPVLDTSPIPFSPGRYYKGQLKLLTDGESISDSFSSVNEALQLLDGQIQNKVSVRMDDSDPEKLVIFKN